MEQISIEDFIQKIESEFPDIPKGKLTPNSKFKESVDWDSINALMFIVFINIEYDVKVVADEFIKANTIQDVFDIVKKKVSEKESIINDEKSDLINDDNKEAFKELKDVVSKNK